jgi:hypothetical protein
LTLNFQNIIPYFDGSKLDIRPRLLNLGAYMNAEA